MSWRCHCMTWRHASRSTRAPSAWIMPDSSAIGMNSAGEITPRSGSRQRSSASTPHARPRLHLDLRLVDEEELVVHQAAAHVGLELQPQLHARVHVGGVEAVGVAARVLGRVHRGVRLLDQAHARRRASSGYIDTPIEQVSVGVWSARRNGAWNDSRTRASTVITSKVACAGSRPGRITHELVAAQPRDGVRLAHGAGQPLRDRLQQLVAGVVAQRVVDPLEVVEVEEQAGDVRAVALRLREDLPQPLVEQRAVGQAGQDVVLRELVGVRGRDLELLACAARPCPPACAGSSRPPTATRRAAASCG